MSTGDPPLPGGELEYGVLVALWEGGPSTARALHERIGAPHGLVLTTITKVLERLGAKGLVERAREERSFVYRAAVARPAVDGARLRQLLRATLTPPVRPAMAALVDAVASFDPALLDELARAVEARRRSRGGS
jgi:predicted transcriptional regulator